MSNETVVQPYQTYKQETADRYKKTYIPFKYIPNQGKVNKVESKWGEKGVGAAARRLRQAEALRLKAAVVKEDS